MQIIPFPAHYQSVYTHFDISSFSLISCNTKGRLLHFKRACFPLQKGVFYMAKEHLLLFSYESFLQKANAKWLSFPSHFLSNLYYYGVQSLVCSPMNDKQMCFIYPIRMSPSNICAMRFPLASSKVRNASTVFFSKSII